MVLNFVIELKMLIYINFLITYMKPTDEKYILRSDIVQQTVCSATDRKSKTDVLIIVMLIYFKL